MIDVMLPVQPTNPITECVKVVDISPRGVLEKVIKTKIKGNNVKQGIEVICPITNLTITPVNDKNETIGNSARIGTFLITDFNTTSKISAYKISYTDVTTNQKREYLSDKFCVRPDKFVIPNFKNNVRMGTIYQYKLQAQDANGEITKNYKGSIDFIGNIQYSSGNFHKGQNQIEVMFFKSGNQPLTIVDSTYCNIDENDTPAYNREIKFTGNSDVSEGSKYFAGVGTNEAENKVENNTVDVDVRQNVRKDLKFNKVEW